MNTLYHEMNHIVKAIDDLDLGDWVISQPECKSCTFLDNPNFKKIKNHPVVLQDYHSSCSFARAFKKTRLFYFQL